MQIQLIVSVPLDCVSVNTDADGVTFTVAIALWSFATQTGVDANGVGNVTVAVPPTSATVPAN